MIRDLDDTIRVLLQRGAAAGSLLAQADINLDIPDARWRLGLTKLTVNCYLYDIRENRDLRTAESVVQRGVDKTHAIRRKPPARIACAYCITAWSIATMDPVLEEHRLLSQVLTVLLKNPTIPSGALQGGLVNQIPPYPTVIASTDGVKNQPEFWRSLDQLLKPSLNYVVTLALLLDEAPPQLPLAVAEFVVNADNMAEFHG